MDRQQPWFDTGAGYHAPPTPTHKASVVHTIVLKWKHGWHTQYVVVHVIFS